MGKPNIAIAIFIFAIVVAMIINFVGAENCSRCDDGNPCTADLCSIDTKYSCTHKALDGEYGSCSGEIDGCSVRACVEGGCVEKKVSSCNYGVECLVPTLINPPYEFYKIGLGRPAFTCIIRNMDNVSGKMDFSAEIEGYSSLFEKTIELGPNETGEVEVVLNFNQDFYSLDESTFSMLKTKIVGSGKTVYSNSETVQIEKATNYAPPKGEEDVLAVWVTYNDPCIEEIISEAKKFAPDGEFKAYQRTESERMDELAAVFYALRYQNISYVSSTISTTDNGNTFYNQNVRLPYQSLKYKQMNCVDGAVLYAAILEKLEYETAVAFSPGHAFVLVKSKGGSWGSSFFSGMFGGWGKDWIAIETTDTGDETTDFEGAVRAGQSALESAVIIVDVHDVRERGAVPMPVKEHECGITDLTKQAEEHQALLSSWGP